MAGMRMDLLEAVAWIGSRDEEIVTEAVRHFNVDAASGGKGSGGAAAWFWLDQALIDATGEGYDVPQIELFDRCAAGDLSAIGLRGPVGMGFEKIPPLDWIEAEIVPRERGIKPKGWIGGLWEDVKFTRTAVLALWPLGELEVPAQASSGKKTAKNSGQKSRPANRPPKSPGALSIFSARLLEGKTKPDRAEEARKIVGLWTGPNPPKPKSVSAWIAKYHDRGLWEDGRITNGPQIATLVEGDKVGKAAS